MPPLTATLYTSPTTAACVLPFAIVLEGPKVITRLGELQPNEIWLVLGTMSAVATLVFVLLVSEYWLVNATSSLALSVAGVFKELLTIGGGILIFSEHMSLMNVIGFIICQIGIAAYMWLRYDPNDIGSEPVQMPPAELPLTYGVVPDSDEESAAEDTNENEEEALSLRSEHVEVPIGR